MTEAIDLDYSLPYVAAKQGSTSRRGRPRKSIEVKREASDHDSDITSSSESSSSDEDPLIATRTAKSKTQPAKKILQAVAVPSTTLATSAGPRRRVPSSQTPSSMDSVSSTTRDHSMEYDTPATSAAATPAEQSLKTKSSLQYSKSNLASLQQSRTSTVMPSGKRKRDFEADARLAEALQAEEYGDQQAKPTKRRRRGGIKDSDDDDDDSLLSDLPREASLDSAVDSNSKKSKSSGRAFLPTRAARDAAKMTISVSLGITDSEDDSISEFSDSDSDSEDFDEDDNEVLPAADVAVPALDATATDPNQATTAPAARRRRRRMPNNGAETRTEYMSRRRLEGVNYRVSQVARASNDTC